MNLGDALDDWPSGGNNQSAGGGVWPGQPSNPGFPGGPHPNPVFPSGPGPNPGFPGGPGPNPSFPGGPHPNPGFPSGPGPNPSWPEGPSPHPTWPGAGGGGGAWPSPQPAAPGGWLSPGGPGPAPAPGPVPSFPVTPQQNVTVPFHQKLPSGIYDKLLITIAGTIKPNADKFTVDLSSGKDIAFHFNPRFNDQGQRTIVRNSFIGQQWGTEERELKNFPFVQGKNFEVKILCTNTEYKVAVDGSHLLTFRHRFNNLSSIQLFAVYNDVTLSKVTMEKLS